MSNHPLFYFKRIRPNSQSAAAEATASSKQYKKKTFWPNSQSAAAEATASSKQYKKKDILAQ